MRNKQEHIQAEVEKINMFPIDQNQYPAQFNPQRIQTVSELTSSLTLLLETEFPFVAISGEISGLRRPYSGHQYFILKDTQAQIRCVLFKNQQRYLSQPLKEGAKVICKGRISVYKQRGEYQIIVDHVTDEGVGRLQQEFEQLKNKLFNEGLFAPESKKKVPPFARKICLITSPTGAAVHDFLKKALERFPNLEVEILPAIVQGENAAKQIIKQINLANHRDWADVIVLTRGGGSLEDLAAFNDENLARAIHASRLPIVSAIGHEVDFTIADFVADHRSPTPSAAADEIIFNKELVRSELKRFIDRITNALQINLEVKRDQFKFLEKLLKDPQKIIDLYRLKVDHTALNLLHSFGNKNTNAKDLFDSVRQRLLAQNPEKTLSTIKIQVNVLTMQLLQNIKNTLQVKREKFTRQATLLDALSPLSVLGRGYALALNEKKEIIRSFKQVKPEEEILLKIEEGSIRTVVKEVFED